MFGNRTFIAWFRIAQCAAHDQVADRERVWMAECAHRDVVRRPRSDARQFDEGCDECVQRLTGAEMHAAIGDRACECEYGRRASTARIAVSNGSKPTGTRSPERARVLAASGEISGNVRV